jgi:hypothetical protein
MHDEDICPEQEADAAVLALLIDSPGPWAVDEVQREIGDAVAAADSLARLVGGGLAHRIDGFVFPSRAARLATETLG